MILLDTDVVSEGMKPAPDARVLAWLDAQVAETLFLSSLTVAELLFGVGALPEGRRREMLAAAVEGVVGDIAGRILPFDEAAALCYAECAVRARAAGVGVVDPWVRQE